MWTEKNIERLKELHSQGMTFTQIGAILGCTKNAVAGKINRLGLSKKVNANHGKRAKQWVPYSEIAGTKRCQFPHNMNQTEKGSKLWCGNPAMAGEAYCEEHYNMVYSKTYDQSGNTINTVI